MPRKKRIEQYEHKGKTRVNNPEVGLVDVALEPPEQKKRYAYDPHLDPSLQWAGKAERTSFEVPSVSLHVHERIDPRTIIEAVRRKNGNGTISWHALVARGRGNKTERSSMIVGSRV